MNKKLLLDLLCLFSRLRNFGCPRDVLYLDLALEAAARGVVEANIATVKAAADTLPAAMRALAASTHNACLAFGSNHELVLCLKDLQVCLLGLPKFW